MLINLLANAVKFTAPGGRIAVTVARHVGAADAAVGGAAAPRVPDGRRAEAALPTWLLIRVRDTGGGIPADDQERVFEPFVQPDPARTRVSGGSGLGLAISRRIARLMDGDLTLASRQRALLEDPAFPVAEGLEIMGKLLTRARELARAGFLRAQGSAAD